MSKKNLPIKVILQKTEDVYRNNGGGKLKFFGEVTPQLQTEISGKFESLLTFYDEVFHKLHIPHFLFLFLKNQNPCLPQVV